MNNLASDIKEKQKELKVLERELEEKYYRLGKDTQEYMDSKKNEINLLVDKIIELKKEIVGIHKNIKKEGQ